MCNICHVVLVYSVYCSMGSSGRLNVSNQDTNLCFVNSCMGGKTFSRVGCLLEKHRLKTFREQLQFELQTVNKIPQILH